MWHQHVNNWCCRHKNWHHEEATNRQNCHRETICIRTTFRNPITMTSMMRNVCMGSAPNPTKAKIQIKNTVSDPSAIVFSKQNQRDGRDETKLHVILWQVEFGHVDSAHERKLIDSHKRMHDDAIVVVTVKCLPINIITTSQCVCVLWTVMCACVAAFVSLSTK